MRRSSSFGVPSVKLNLAGRAETKKLTALTSAGERRKLWQAVHLQAVNSFDFEFCIDTQTMEWTQVVYRVQCR
jgi:hypothetical protein